MDVDPPPSSDSRHVQLARASVVAGGLTPEPSADGGHSATLLLKLDSQRRLGQLCDVQIDVEDRSFFAHRAVLAAGSPYFAAMFASELREATAHRILLKEVCASAFSHVLDFVYSAKVALTTDNVEEVMIAAAFFQMDALQEECEQFAARFISIETAVPTLQLAEQHGCGRLAAAVDAFLADHWMESMDSLSGLTVDQMERILARDDLLVDSEQQAFQSVCEWLDQQTDPERVGADAPYRLLTRIRLSCLSASFLLQSVRCHPHFQWSAECAELVSRAMCEILLRESRRQECWTASSGRVKRRAEGVRLDASPPQNAAQYGWASGATIRVGGEAGPSSVVEKTGESIEPEVGSSLLSSSTLWRPRLAQSGVVFCVGGRGRDGAPFRTVEACDARRDLWFRLTDMNQQRRHVGVVATDGFLYAIGGHDGASHLSSAERFDVQRAEWTPIAPMGVARRGIAVAALPGALFAVGGLDDAACFQTVERFDVDLNAWATVAPLTVQRGGVGVASADDRWLFAVGGNDGHSSLDSCERYDPFVDRWRTDARMHYRRAGAGVCWLDGYGCLYAIGGFDDNSPLATCERLDPREGRWTVLKTMHSARGGVGVAATRGGRILAVGGHDGADYLRSVESFDPRVDAWLPVAPIRQCRAGAGVSAADMSADSLRSLLASLSVSSVSNNAPSSSSSSSVI